MPIQCFMAVTEDDWKRPGAISNWPLSDGTPNWVLCLPNGALWNIYGKMSDGSKGWDITGDLPKITARPSIHSHANGVHGEYHGWLTDGILSDDIEGRTYS